jgi:hypothetical protein
MQEGIHPSRTLPFNYHFKTPGFATDSGSNVRQNRKANVQNAYYAPALTSMSWNLHCDLYLFISTCMTVKLFIYSLTVMQKAAPRRMHSQALRHYPTVLTQSLRGSNTNADKYLCIFNRLWPNLCRFLDEEVASFDFFNL